jgi:ankyrin repeat protein
MDALHTAILLLNHGADINAVTSPVSWCAAGETPLSMAARLGRLHLVKLFVDILHQRKEEKKSPSLVTPATIPSAPVSLLGGIPSLNAIHEAVAYNQVECVRLLMSYGYGHQLGTRSQSILHTAAMWRSADVIRMLVAITPAMLASPSWNGIAAIDAKYYISPNALDVDGRNAIHYLIFSNGHIHTERDQMCTANGLWCLQVITHPSFSLFAS